MRSLPRLVGYLSIFFILGFTNAAIGQTPTYSIEDIAPLTVFNPNISYFPKKINNSGLIAGLRYQLDSGTVVGFVWAGGAEIPAGGTNSSAYDVSNSPIVAGRGTFAQFDTRAYLFNPVAHNLFWLPCPLFTDFGRFCEPYAISDAGIVVGTSDPRFLYPESPEASSRALRWDPGMVNEIFPGSSQVSVANDINAAGTIAGMIGYQPFILSNTTGLHLLGNLSNTGALGQMVFAKAINNPGHAIGGHTVNSDGLAQRAFFWDGVSAIDIGTLGILSVPPGDNRPVVGANDINNSDQVVGDAAVGVDQNDTMVTHAFIWDAEHGMRDLNDLIPQGSGIVLTQATGINDSGEIAAVGYKIGDNPYIQRGYRLKAPVETKTPVIFVPGTMGSSIRGTWRGFDVPFWVNVNPSPSFTLPSINNLTLDTSSIYYTENLYVSDVLQSGLSGVYKSLIDSLKSKGFKAYDYEGHLLSITGCDLSQRSSDPNVNPSLFVFPYDWRQDNNQSADKLREYIECVQQFYPIGTKINVVAHSQGGLVARRYVLQSQLRGEPHHLDKIIAIASPFLGAPESTYKLYTGGDFNWFSFVVSPSNIKFLAPYFPSMHQLLPSRQYQEFEGGIVVEGGDVNGNGVPDEVYTFEQNTAQLNTDFPETTPGTVGAGFHDLPGQDDWRQDQSGIEYYNIVGERSQMDTTRGLAVMITLRCKYNPFGTDPFGEGRCYNDRLYIPDMGPGDHTVPTISASRIKGVPGQSTDLNAPLGQTYLYHSLDTSLDDSAEHNGLHKAERIQATVAFLLGVGPEPDIDPPTGGGSLTAGGGKSERSVRNQNGSFSSLVSGQRLTRYSANEVPTFDLSDFRSTFYLSLIGKSDVIVRDQNGNTAQLEDGVLKNDVPALSNYKMIGDDSVLLTMAADQAYTVEFKAVERSMGIELLEGKGNKTLSHSIKWLDVNLPAGADVRLNVSGSNVSSLEYDADGDGQFETLVAPTVSVSGAAASDVTPPTINISVTQQGNAATGVITAQDEQSGVSQIWYSVDGQTFHRYTSAFTIGYTAAPVQILVFAQDAVANRSGLYSKTFSFAPAGATVRRGLTLNGRIEGTIQQLSGENTVLNSSARLIGDLLVPGTPNLVRNGNPVFGGVVVGPGSTQPANYSVILNSGSQSGHLITRTDPVTMPTVAPPPAPTGTRNVSINNATQSIGDFATLRNLTLNSNAGQRAIPPGTYGNFVANGGSGFIIGVAGSSQPSVYNLAALTLNSNSQLQVVGPVVLTLGNGLTLNASAGTSGHPEWLQIRVAAGNVTLNSGSLLYGHVLVPSGTVTLNSRLVGNVTSDRLTINSNGILQVVWPSNTP